MLRARRCNIIKSYLNALSFLTVLRFNINDFDGRRAVYSFVPVGLTIGIVPFLILKYLSAYLPSQATTMLIVLFLVLITGALHLDGLADTADGLFSFRSRERMLEIMRDSRIGTMGAVAVVMVLLIKSFTVYAISNPLFLLLIPAYARYSMVFGVYMFEYARDEGTAKSFFGGYSPFVFAQGLILMAISYFTGVLAFAVLNIGFIIYIFVITQFYRKRIGGITGDMLGAMCESCEAFMLILAVCL